MEKGDPDLAPDDRESSVSPREERKVKEPYLEAGILYLQAFLGKAGVTDLHPESGWQLYSEELTKRGEIWVSSFLDKETYVNTFWLGDVKIIVGISKRHKSDAPDVLVLITNEDALGREDIDKKNKTPSSAIEKISLEKRVQDGAEKEIVAVTFREASFDENGKHRRKTMDFETGDRYPTEALQLEERSLFRSFLDFSQKTTKSVNIKQFRSSGLGTSVPGSLESSVTMAYMRKPEGVVTFGAESLKLMRKHGVKYK